MDREAKPVPSLCQVYQDHFLIGAAVNARTILTHESLLTQHFSSITAENEMKFEELHPALDRYDFQRADALVNFAEQHGMKVRGHTLVWHNQTPSFVFSHSDGTARTREQVLAILREHMTTVMGRYKGRVYAWDVVNEAVSDADDRELRDTPWLRQVGEDYLSLAFEMAHEIDPNAQLFYNDYNETHPGKRERIYRMVKSLLSRGVPIHGIGLQGHYRLGQPPRDEIRDAIERYASLGVKLQVTELDVSTYAWNDQSREVQVQVQDARSQERQAQRYEELFSLFRAYKDVLTGVTLWGIADDATWLDNFPVRGRKDWPLLFTEDHVPKPAFWVVVDEATR
ncbi:MAG: endo-1,4-beta-xylanase [Firmicutes bacterium]|nr:endo-1,4-beta-xylanase [Bacillota bacterium]